MVATLSDLLIRRTAIFFWDAAGGVARAEAIADVLAQLLGWTPERRQQEIDEYDALVERHLSWTSGDRPH